jgi:hypothetical protein
VTGRRHARQAALPPAGYARDRQPGPGSLAVTVAGESGGTEAVFDFSVLPGSPALLAACAAGFARMAGPDQSWRAAATCLNGFKAIREFLRWAAALDQPPQGAEHITPAVWAQWRLSRPGTVYGRACQLAIRQWLPQVPGIPAATIAASARRIPAGPAPSEAAYSREEFGQIKAAAARTFGTALVRIRAGREHLLRWQAGGFPRPGIREQYRQTQPETAGYLTGEALEVLQRTGDVPLTRSGHRSVRARHARALGGAGPQHTWARLFLTMPEAAALAVLVCDQGWNRSVLDVMTVPDDMPGAGEDNLDIYPAGIVKCRRPARVRYSSANLADTGPGSSGRLIRQAIEVTQPARITVAALGSPADRLLVSRRDQFRGRQDMFCLGAPPGDSMRRWAASAGLAGSDGQPLQVSLRRLRRTVQVLIRREPAQNSQQTHESAYVLRDRATLPEAAQVTAQGLTDAVSHARATVKMRMLLDTGPGRPAAGVAGLAQALADGALDTATGACLHFTNSPFGQPGQPCTASFLAGFAPLRGTFTRVRAPRARLPPHRVARPPSCPPGARAGAGDLPPGGCIMPSPNKARRHRPASRSSPSAGAGRPRPLLAARPLRRSPAGSPSRMRRPPRGTCPSCAASSHTGWPLKAPGST